MNRASEQPDDARGRRPSPAILAAALVAIVLATYWPAISYDFGGWDDDMNVASNPRLLRPSLNALAHYWTHFEADLYVPVTYTVWWAVAQIAYEPPSTESTWRPSLNPHDFHLLNILLHIVATLATFEVLRCCVQDTLAGCAGALLFALHPLQVEPVAWIAGTKDVLSGALALIAIWQYLAADEASRHRLLHWTLGTIAFVLAMLAKPGAVVTPVLAWLLDLLLIQRPIRDATRRVLPWIVLTIPCIVWTRLAQPAAAVGAGVPLLVRPLIALDAIAFYLWKLFWPVKLGVDYSRTPQRAIAAGWIYFTWVVPAAALVIAFIAARRARATIGPAVLAIFIVALLPVLGLIPFDFQAYSTVADHYMYLAMLGPALGIAWLLARYRSAFLRTLAVLALCILLILTRLQLRHWSDAMAIFAHAVDVNPQSWASHNTLTFEYTRSGDFDRALKHARAAVASNPNAVLARFSLAAALANAGKKDEAIAAYRDLIARDPTHVRGRLQLAALLERERQFDEALAQYKAVLQMDPNNGEARAAVARLVEPKP